MVGQKKYICDCGREYVPAAKWKDTRVKCTACIKKYRSADVKKRAVEYLGGKCVDCKGVFLPIAYDFDHIHKETKSFKISGSYRLRWTELVKELDKCELRCAVCHRVKHYLEEI